MGMLRAFRAANAGGSTTTNVSPPPTPAPRSEPPDPTAGMPAAPPRWPPAPPPPPPWPPYHGDGPYQPPFSPAPQHRWHRTAFGVFVVVATSLALVAVVVAASLSVFRSANHAHPSALDLDALQLAVQSSDIGSRWVPVSTQFFTSSNLNPSMTCLPSDPTGRRQAGVIQQYSRDLQRNDLESGHLSSVVFLEASAKDAEVTRQRLEAPGYAACGQSEAVTDVEYGGGRDPQVGAVTMLTDLDGDSGMGERFTVSYTFRGQPAMETDDYFDVVQGKVESRLLISQCGCSAIDPSLETTLLETVSTRVRASTFGQ